MSQLAFDLTPRPKAPEPETTPARPTEEAFFRLLFPGRPLRERSPCHQCGIPYLSISYHYLYTCPARPLDTPVVAQVSAASGPIEEVKAEISPPPIETPQEETPTRSPHWYLWVTGSPRWFRPYTPPLKVRQRCIPGIACTLYRAGYAAAQAKDLFDNAAPGYVRLSKTFYEASLERVEKLIGLLSFCGIEEQAARELSRRGWKDGIVERFVPWRTIGPGLLLHVLGYELKDQEEDGSDTIKIEAFARWLEEEGVKGR